MIIEPIGAGALTPAAEAVESRMGLHFGPERLADLARGLRAAAKISGAASPEIFVKSLIDGVLATDGWDALIQALTIGETYFYRDRPFFERLEHVLLPGLIRRRRASGLRLVRIWSAGCCTGEEPYSVAMLLHDLLPDREDWAISILGTDLNPEFLERARKGVYGDWSLRAMPEASKRAHLEVLEGRRFRVKAAIRRMVRFAPLNLARDEFPSPENGTQAFDLILCRNVLMYMAPERAMPILTRLGQCLQESGYLALAPVETGLAVPSLKAVAPDCPYVLARRDAGQGPFDSAPSPQPSWSGTAPKQGRTGLPQAQDVFGRLPPSTRPRDPDAGAVPGAPPEAGGGPPEAGGALPEAGKDPAEASALYRAAEAHADRGELDQALAEGIRAAEKSGSAEHAYLVAAILMEMGRGEEASAWLEDILARHADFVMAHFSLGNVALAAGKRAIAAERFAKAAGLARELPPDRTLPGSNGSMTAGRLLVLLADAKRTGNGP